jgi:hypothetical protein
LLALYPNLSIRTVTSLEPRTPHQPEKLKKLSKNEYVFTPSIFPVNEKDGVVTTCVFSGVQPVHRLLTENSAGRRSDSRSSHTGCGISRDSFHAIDMNDPAGNDEAIVNIGQKPQGIRRFDTSEQKALRYAISTSSSMNFFSGSS